MTTATEQQIPDAAAVLRRAARRGGEDPLPPSVLDDLADAVQTQIVEPLLGGVPAGPDPAVLAEQVRALTAERDQLQAKLDDSVTIGNAWAEALAETAEQRAALWELAKAVVRKMIDERSSVDGERHKHYYPAERPDTVPGDCQCGHPYPRAHITDRSHETDTEPDAWGRFFAGLRTELADWNPKGHKR